MNEGCTAKTKVSYAIDAHLNEIATGIEGLQNQVKALQEKLIPVSTPYDPQPPIPLRELSTMSPINQKIEELALQLQNCLNDIEQLTSNLDI